MLMYIILYVGCSRRRHRNYFILLNSYSIVLFFHPLVVDIERMLIVDRFYFLCDFIKKKKGLIDHRVYACTLYDEMNGIARIDYIYYIVITYQRLLSSIFSK